MKIDELKIEIVQKILACNDVELLNEIQQILTASEVEETTIEFIPDAEEDEPEEFPDTDKKL